MARVSFENLSGVGYTCSVEKPLGIVFGDNDDPYYGLVVDSVEKDMNAANAGIKVGDNLIAINGESVVGEDFDFCMDFLKSSEGVLKLQLLNIEGLYDSYSPHWKYECL